MSKVFYKYRADSEFTEQIFTSGNVYLSTAAGLNDPFECSLQDIGSEWIAEKVKEMKQAGVAGFLLQANRSLRRHERFFGLAGLEISRVIERLGCCKGIEEKYNFYGKFILDRTGHPPSNCERIFSGLDAQLNSVGIFSLSARSDHPLMWAHYAREHTGVCIGFEKIPDSKMDHAEHFAPVIYSDSLPEMDANGFQVVMSMSLDELGNTYTSSLKVSSSDKTFQKVIATKPTCWSYEEEWRYMEPCPGLFKWPGTISELTFGLRCSDARRKSYIHLAEEHIPNGVRLFQIRKKHGTNALERVPLETPVTSPRCVRRADNDESRDSEAMSLQDFAARMERLIRQEKYGEALFQIDENLKRDDGSPVLLSLKGTAHGYAGQHDRALECFTKLTEAHPEVAQAWYQKSCALSELGRHEEALGSLQKAFKLDPNDASTAFNMGMELLRVQTTPEEALRFLRLAEHLGHRRAHQAISLIEERSSKPGDEPPK
jgi:Protein of unknown function (DUF2971)/Tetratricopeptide repeat